MKSVRKWIRDFFGFSGSEINGFLILIPIMVALIVSKPLYHGWVASSPRNNVRDSIELDRILAAWDTVWQEPLQSGIKTDSPFYFDPNTAHLDDLMALGFGQHLANRIAAYRRKGGVFRIKSDLLKIYGLDSALYGELYDYIELPAKRSPAFRNDRPFSGPRVVSEKKRANTKFDINTADTLLLKSIYGIGSRLASRIVKFRDGLGGFVSPDQLFEVYGLDSLTVERLLASSFIADDFVPRKIDINTADEEELSAHPYIRYRLARLLVSYRFQHGDFIDVSDIKNLSAAQPDELERLLPYLEAKN